MRPILTEAFSALLLTACAHHAAVVSSPPVAASEAKPAAEEHPHGAGGAHVPVALPHHVADGRTGAALDDAQLEARLRAARVIFVGEEHPNPHHHAAQLEVLERLYAADPSVALGLEMLPRALQPALDGFVSGQLDEAAFLKQVTWDKTWGYPFGFYRPLLLFCRLHHLRAFALNAPRELSHTLAFKGPEALTAEQKKQLPEMKPGPEAHREFVREAFGAHPHGKFSDASFERFYLAQLLWDETMAESVARALAGADAPRRLLVVAGEGHTRRFAIPDRAVRRGAKPYLTILPTLDSDAEDAQTDGVADVLWILETS